MWDETLGRRSREHVAIAEEQLRSLFERTANLTALHGDDDPLATRENRDLLAAARALTAPYLSRDNFAVIAKVAGATATVRQMIDVVRVPWLDEDREPTPDEVAFAIRSTAIQMAGRLQETEMRTSSSKAQEHMVKVILEGAGLVFVEPALVRDRLGSRPGYRPNMGIEQRNLDLALERNEFTSEFLCAGTKCDVPIRTPDGRLFALEAKVSNSASNTTKRLIREVVGKEATWRRAFGDDTLVGGFMAGVFSLKNLHDAQAKRTLLFFQHEPQALSAFVEADFRPRPLQSESR